MINRTNYANAIRGTLKPIGQMKDNQNNEEQTPTDDCIYILNRRY